METAELVKFTRTQETRIDKLDNEVQRLKHENQQMRDMIAQLRVHMGKLSKEVRIPTHKELLR